MKPKRAFPWLLGLVALGLAGLAQAVTCQSGIRAGNPDRVYVADPVQGTVTDSRTGRMWKTCVEGQTWDGATCVGNGGAYTWSEALALAETAAFAGHDDWRLPNINELSSLTEPCRTWPSINNTLFPNTSGSGVWSGSPSAYYSDFAWYVGFDHGVAYDDSRSFRLYVRLVRGGQSFDTFALTVSKAGAGGGTVTSTPAGINCGTTCAANFPAGTASVTLAASPAAGSTFAGWSTNCAPPAADPRQCTVTVITPQTVTATFSAAPASYSLSINKVGNGTVTSTPAGITCGTGSGCTASFASGANLILTASPASGSTFTSWSGCAPVAATPTQCTLSLTANRAVTATFSAAPPPALTATQSATGYQAGGTTSINNTLSYPAGQTLLSLVWRPRLPAGWTLTGASGDGTPQVNGNEILFSGGALTANPLRFSYQVAVPAGAAGAQSVAATVEYQWTGMANPATLAATPDPLTLTPGAAYHTADYQDPRWRIDATEASRVLAYWRSTGYHADAAGADGYAPGAGATAGTRHTADYQDPAWKIDATEASRVLAYWRANGYRVDAAGADGYAPGAATTASALLPATAATATQRLLGIPRAGGTVELELTLTAPAAPLSALARLNLPAGWTLTSVTGDGGPSLDPNDPTLILWTGQTLPATLRARVTLAVPAGATGGGSVSATLEGFLSDGRSYTAEAQPGALPAALDTRLIVIPEIAGASGSARHFRIRVPDGVGTLTVRTQGASGEVDLYVRRGTAATPTAFDCRSATPGPNETCVLNAPAGGDHDLLLQAGGDYADLSLLVSWPQP